uniref:Chloroplast light harvesting protein n=1 Tax=Coccolithus braarudii TaxID=221442 RepID=A0A7S0L514_9EUKA|eukprot:CAMPEP_0183351594 /NCGR_PEP_ID=MMETSP0164_2-20130417/25908_1 /TAXON_ID=221442 /ORGANISM="Coccolithus pelagicus ssp braarudi, Strain PLY182g" /LENGTH=270 /DNA_ID=CAMNT_0025523817 /DNA_START=30 /DNA_END=842 /DNA_ORIENTATION=+
MLALTSAAALAFSPIAPLRTSSLAPAGNDVRMETTADLEKLAKELNPVLGFWDPFGLTGDIGLGGVEQSEAIGFLRHAEIKHGRVAMAAFVGYLVGASGAHFPWNLTPDVSYASIAEAGSPQAQWDATPTAAKLQILGFIGFLEVMSETQYVLELSGEKHYMRGGKPGAFPSLKAVPWPHPIPLDLFDPFGFSKNKSPEAKAKGLVTELNNGRLAMWGILAFVSESKVPGSVPALKGLIAPYSGETMAPFSATDIDLPLVKEMLAFSPFA